MVVGGWMGGWDASNDVGVALMSSTPRVLTNC